MIHSYKSLVKWSLLTVGSIFWDFKRAECSALIQVFRGLGFKAVKSMHQVWAVYQIEEGFL